MLVSQLITSPISYTKFCIMLPSVILYHSKLRSCKHNVPQLNLERKSPDDKVHPTNRASLDNFKWINTLKAVLTNPPTPQIVNIISSTHFYLNVCFCFFLYKSIGSLSFQESMVGASASQNSLLISKCCRQNFASKVDRIDY